MYIEHIVKEQRYDRQGMWYDVLEVTLDPPLRPFPGTRVEVQNMYFLCSFYRTMCYWLKT